MDTGELVKKGDNKVLGEAQVLFDDPNGMNLNGRFATGLDRDSEVQFEGGVGSIDFYVGAFYKWMPFPDTDDQPAIGGRVGVTFADIEGISTYGFNLTPMISKSFNLAIGDITPYGGLEFGLQNNVDDSFVSFQFVAGAQWSPDKFDFRELADFDFLLELGLDVDDAFDYLSLGVAYNF